MLKSYYLQDLKKLHKFLIPKGASFVFINKDNLNSKKKFEYIIANEILAETKDVQKMLSGIAKICTPTSRIIAIHYNHFWEPILKSASKLGFRKRTREQNWLDDNDIINFLNLTDFDLVTNQKRLLIPIYIPFISNFANRFIAPLPIINHLCLTTYVVAKPKSKKNLEYTVSIVVPARNEEGNIEHIVKSIPKFGKSQEIIFVEGNSTDQTWNKVKDEELKTKSKKAFKTIKAYKQKGKGKANAVWMGFEKAKGDILMIYDADRTVDATDLPKFYNALASGLGEFANGSRMVYPMENQAMQTLNKIGNRLFSSLFTWILGQRFKDTLCGTKALFKNDYLYMKKYNNNYFRMDPFGDFALIFGAIKNNLKIVEIPIRYKERVYGSTNISRFKHGLILLKMTILAFREFKSF